MSSNDSSVALAAGSARAPEPSEEFNRPLWRRALATNAIWVFVLDLFLIALFSIISKNHVFWTTENFQSLAQGGTESLLLTLGVTMFLAAGLFDLSVGANLVLSSVAGGEAMNAMSGSPEGVAILVGLLACLAAGMVFGLANGLIISYLRVNSLIATLGTLGIATGLSLVITNGGDLGGFPPALQNDFGLRLIAGIPLPAIVALVLTVVFWAVLRYLRFGLHTLAIGSSAPSAARAGLPVRRHVVVLAILVGACAGLAGFVDLARYGSTTITGHNTDALAALTAAVIGGTALTGGRATIFGSLWGTVLAVVLLTGLIIVNVAPYYQQIVIGLVLVAAVAIDQFRSRTERPQYPE